MTKETYPLPGAPLRLVFNNTNPEYGATRQQWEERVFRNAHHYNVVRIATHQGSEITTVDTFAKALHLVHEADGHRKLIYVVTEQAEAFCMSPKDYPRFAELELEKRLEQRS